MRKVLFIGMSAVALAITAHAQETRPAQSPTPDNDVVKISTELIQVDVTVTARKGKPVTDLRADEIQIFENGKKQKITNFGFVSSGRPTGVKNDQKSKMAGPELPPQPVRPEDVHRTIAIVIDDLSMSFESSWSARDAVKRFVREQVQDGDLVAILRTGTGIGSLQQFTSDKRQLLAAADKIRFNMNGSAKVGVFNPIAESFDRQVDGTQSMGGQTRDRASAIDASEKFDAEINDLRESIFVSGTLGAINYIIRGMKDLPGRKSITLISDGFRIFNRSSSFAETLRHLTDLANRASVVIYAIDARGLVVTGLTAEDDTSGLTFERLESMLAGRRDTLIDTQSGLIYLAHNTGGFAVVNQNGINHGLQRVIDDQSYYLVGFEPDDDTFDPKKNRYNKLEVKVSRKDVKVRYRSGFYAVADERIAELRRANSAPTQALYDALTSPFAVSDVSLRLNALFMAGDRRSAQLRSFLHIDPSGLTFVKDAASGKRKTTFDLIAYTFGDNGQPVEGEKGTYAVTLSEEGYALMQKHGLVYDFVFALKKPGAYQMRIAIRDTATNKTGSASQFVEVPNLKKDRLALSGVLLGNIDLEDVAKLRKLSPEAALKLINPISDTAIRQFRPSSFLTYEMTIFNPKTGPSGTADVSVEAKVFNERQLIFEGQPTKVGELTGPTGDIPWQGSLELGSGLGPGHYTLQLIVTDNNAKGGGRTAIHFVPFEIVQR